MNHRICKTASDYQKLLSELWNRKMAKGYFNGNTHAFADFLDFCDFFHIDPLPFFTEEGVPISSVNSRRIKPEMISLFKSPNLPSCIFWNFEASWEITGHPKCRIFYAASLQEKRKVKR